MHVVYTIRHLHLLSYQFVWVMGVTNSKYSAQLRTKNAQTKKTAVGDRRMVSLYTTMGNVNLTPDTFVVIWTH